MTDGSIVPRRVPNLESVGGTPHVKTVQNQSQVAFIKKMTDLIEAQDKKARNLLMGAIKDGPPDFEAFLQVQWETQGLWSALNLYYKHLDEERPKYTGIRSAE